MKQIGQQFDFENSKNMDAEWLNFENAAQAAHESILQIPYYSDAIQGEILEEQEEKQEEQTENKFDDVILEVCNGIMKLCIVDREKDAIKLLKVVGNKFGFESDYYNLALETLVDTTKKTGLAKGFGSAKGKKVKDHKKDAVESLLLRPCGANATEIHAITGWQIHTIRAFVSTRKKHGFNAWKNVMQKSGEKPITTWFIERIAA
ncbi:MAG: DUF3489 domain-containing protein [Magnetococcales bacterium]|nr:DUF3489 domain-containing protein [Magnetococcales bacterium]